MTTTTAPAAQTLAQLDARSTRYLTGANNPLWDSGLAWDLNMGLLTTPATNYVVQLCRYPFWAADNGAYHQGAFWFQFDHAAWWAWLTRTVARLNDPTMASCIYATAPDAIDVCDHTCPNAVNPGHAKRSQVCGVHVTSYPETTIAWAKEWLPRITELGLPAAMVMQDGMEDMLDEIPWDLFEVAFIGGSNEFKLGEGARIVIAEAKRRGKKVHVGRVNSSQRLSYVSSLGADTADGTFLGKGPAKNLPRLMDWDVIKAQTEPRGVACAHCSHFVADRRKGAPKGAKRRIQVRHANKAEIRRWHAQPAAA
jgi:hypothetical protein